MNGRISVGAVLVAAWLSGCTTYRQSGPPHFDVEVSFLDSVRFTYYEPGASAEETPVRVRVSLSGSGHIHYARGRSSRVHNSFWTEADEKHVQDLFTDQIVIDRNEVREIFQALVDAGVFERTMQGRHIADADNAYVLVHARINQRRGLVVTDAREFVDLCKRLMRYLHR